MKAKEMLTVLWCSLKGQRQKIYDNVMKDYRTTLAQTDPQAVYTITKDRHMESSETQTENRPESRLNTMRYRKTTSTL